VGAGVGGGLLIVVSPSLMVISPPPGETMSSGPQAESASMLQPMTSERWKFFTADGPLKFRESMIAN